MVISALFKTGSIISETAETAVGKPDSDVSIDKQAIMPSIQGSFDGRQVPVLVAVTRWEKFARYIVSVKQAPVIKNYARHGEQQEKSPDDQRGPFVVFTQGFHG